MTTSLSEMQSRLVSAEATGDGTSVRLLLLQIRDANRARLAVENLKSAGSMNPLPNAGNRRGAPVAAQI
jgi:hypothetical protein